MPLIRKRRLDFRWKSKTEKSTNPQLNKIYTLIVVEISLEANCLAKGSVL